MNVTSISTALAVRARTIATSRHLPLRSTCLWTGFLAFATVVLGLHSAHAAVTEAWVQRNSNVPSSTTDRATNVVRDAAGDIIVTGSIAGCFPGADMLTIKYSGADGSVLWQQHREANGIDSPDYPLGWTVDASGNVVRGGPRKPGQWLS